MPFPRKRSALQFSEQDLLNLESIRKSRTEEKRRTLRAAFLMDAQPPHASVSPKLLALASSSTESGSSRQPGHALIEEANALVDAYAVILDRALTTYQGRIKPEEARSLLVTAYIQRAKLAIVA
jgi:hypothetical protein